MNLAEIMSEEIRTGHRPKPNRANLVTRNRQTLERKIRQQAQSDDIDPAEVALGYVKQNIGDVQRYVVSKGEQPLRNPVELSVQAFALRNKDIEQVKNAIGCSREDAQTYLDEFEQSQIDDNSSEADNFIGNIIGAVGAVASKGIDKIRAARTAKGKPTKFWDFLSKNTGGELSGQPQKEPLSGVKVLANDVLDEIRKRETKAQINKMLPLIIGGVIVLVLLTVLITKNAGKR